MPYGSINADSIVTSVSGGVLGGGNASIMKNRIINGAMVIDQRNAGASVTASGSYPVDRFMIVASQASKFTGQQNAGSVTPPVGFVNYLGCTSSSAYSVTSGDYFNIQQYIEGYNIADLGWGTANAKTVTLSFQVYSSLTGTFGGALRNDDSSRSYPFTYTVSSANTWTSISVTIAGETSGTWLKTNGRGVCISFGLGVGSTYSGTAGTWGTSNYISATGATSVVGTSGATFYITGVQLEVGSSATGFEYRMYGTEFANCQRYYNKFFVADTAGGSITSLAGFGYTTNLCLTYYQFPVAMRTYPTLSTTGTASDYAILQTGGGQTCTSVPTMGGYTVSGGQITFTVSGTANAGQGMAGRAGGSGVNIYLAYSAEL